MSNFSSKYNYNYNLKAGGSDGGGAADKFSLPPLPLPTTLQGTKIVLKSRVEFLNSARRNAVVIVIVVVSNYAANYSWLMSEMRG